MNSQTAPELFALARGVEARRGAYRCFYCLVACDGSNAAEQYVKDSFTGRDTVGGGQYVCDGCVAAMDERATVKLWTGETREGQKVRGYSWVFCAEDAVAATKAHREWLLSKCLAPPAPPFCICLSDSGQKHLLYRAVVCWSRDPLTVTLEGERVTYRPAELRNRLTLCTRLIAAVGKPTLAAGLRIVDACRVEEYHGFDGLAYAWERVSGQPLSRLALWLAPGKKEASVEYPGCARN